MPPKKFVPFTKPARPLQKPQGGAKPSGEAVKDTTERGSKLNSASEARARRVARRKRDEHSLGVHACGGCAARAPPSRARVQRREARVWAQTTNACSRRVRERWHQYE